MIHPTAEVEEGAHIGDGTRIWHHAHVRSGATIGANCILGYGVYVDAGVHIGDNCKLQNRVSVYHGVTIEDGVFVGPHVAFTNDKHPRAIRADGSLSTDDDWTVSPTLVRSGASIGAAAVILPGVTLGRWCLVGAGAVVSRDVSDHGLVTGNPARLTGYACKCGHTLHSEGSGWLCDNCHETYDLPSLPAPHQRGAAQEEAVPP
jgi:UDP-2-acetamido-3-amino-2,3-dideoxy-glucuronate N-acetyltransferase